MKTKILLSLIFYIILGLMFAGIVISGYTHISAALKVICVGIGMLSAIFGFTIFAKIYNKQIIVK